MSSKGKSAVAGEQDQQGGLVPKLRFPEFRDAPAWELWPLKKLAKRRTRKNVGAKVDRVLTNSAEQGVVDQRDYFEKDIANPGNLEGYFIIEKGDYVYNPRVSNLAPVGPIHKNDVGLGVMSPLYTVFFFDSVKNDFYSHYFKTPHWHQYLRHVSNSGARHDRMAISADDFINMPVPVSNPPEQQKIADCLSSIDALIAAEAEKLEALKDHKKGLMQQLFPAPGETTPRLRLPEFQDAGDWREDQIGRLCNLYQAVTLSTSDLNQSGDYLVYGANGVIGMHDEYNHEESEVIVTCRGATCGEVTRTEAKSWINGNAMVVNPRACEISKDYIYHFLKSDGLKSVISGSAQPQITRIGLSPLLLKYPGAAEQQRIADCLSSIDTLVAAQGSKIDGLKAHKNGLMQQLFPVADEVQA